jgi:hypothetical protein
MPLMSAIDADGNEVQMLELAKGLAGRTEKLVLDKTKTIKYPILDATTIDVQINNTLNDGRISGASTFNNDYVTFGNAYGTYQSDFLRFLGITIPAGATASNCYLTYTSGGSEGTNCHTTIYGNDAASTTAPTSYAEYGALTGTTQTVPWEHFAAWTTNSEYNTPDISTIVQELINSYAPYSNGNLQFMHKETASGSGSYRSAYDYSISTAKSTKLHIEYTEAAAAFIPFTSVYPHILAH